MLEGRKEGWREERLENRHIHTYLGTIEI